MPNNRNSDDYRLSILLSERNYEAFEEIYERYWSPLYKTAFNFLKDQDEAKDVVQDVFERLWENSAQIEIKSLPAYLYASLRNRIINTINRTKVREQYLNTLEDFIHQGQYTTDALIREKELKDLIERRMNTFPPRMRKVFELSRYFNYSYKEIAAELNVTENTVKKQINNALNALRAILGALIAFFFTFLK